MAKDAIPAKAVDAVKAVMESGGKGEVTALHAELNNLSLDQIQSLNKALPSIISAEKKAHPGLPELKLTVTERAVPGSQVKRNEIEITIPDRQDLQSSVQKDLAHFGKSKIRQSTIYRRDYFTEDGKPAGETIFFENNSDLKSLHLTDRGHNASKDIRVDARGVRTTIETDGNGTRKEIEDKARGISHIEYPNGEIEDRNKTGGVTRSFTTYPNGKTMSTVTNDASGNGDVTITQGKNVSRIHMRGGYFSEMHNKNEDGSLTNYTVHEKERRLHIDKALPNGDQVHEELDLNLAFINGYVKHKDAWFGEPLKRPQESPQELKILREQITSSIYQKY